MKHKKLINRLLRKKVEQNLSNPQLSSLLNIPNTSFYRMVKELQIPRKHVSTVENYIKETKEDVLDFFKDQEDQTFKLQNVTPNNKPVSCCTKKDNKVNDLQKSYHDEVIKNIELRSELKMSKVDLENTKRLLKNTADSFREKVIELNDLKKELIKAAQYKKHWTGLYKKIK